MQATRAIYTGPLHPKVITDFAIGAPIYFGELIIQNPFLHAGTVKKEFSPVENPRAYRGEFLKSVIFFLKVIPLVAAGRVDLIPDPCDFDVHLRSQMMQMARDRSAGMAADVNKEPRIKRLMEDDFKRDLMSLPQGALRSQLSRVSPKLDEARLDETLNYVERIKEEDPLAVLQEGTYVGGEKGGQFNLMKLAPNFEMTMYLAQATGSCIVTDSAFRWSEIRKAAGAAYSGFAPLSRDIENAQFAFPQNAEDVGAFAFEKTFAAYPELFRDVFKYLARFSERGPKPNREAQLIGRFGKIHAAAQAEIKRARVSVKEGRISCIFPSRGIQDNTVNRLLLMSSSEKHLPSVPMAFFIEATPGAS